LGELNVCWEISELRVWDGDAGQTPEIDLTMPTAAETAGVDPGANDPAP
jgi:hypothetical protein